MKRKRRFRNGIIALVLLFSMFVPNFGTETIHAASSYTNAMMFYESVNGGKPYAAETVNGTIYYATKAKLAGSSTNLRYHTLGFDVTLVGNGASVSFSVSRTGGSMFEVHNMQYGGYDYILYAIQDRTLYNLASIVNPTAAAKVLDASKIGVVMNAVMTTKRGGSLSGGVVENGAGGLYEWGNVYHLGNYAHLYTMMRTFSGHKFTSYTNIREYLDNYKLYIQYNVEGTEEANLNCSSTATVGNGYAISNGFLSKNGINYMQSSRVLNAMTLVNPSDIALSKKGYHLESGREWTALNRSFTHMQSYMPKAIYSGVGYGNCGITMYANWQPNSYTINYFPNTGQGQVASSRFYYDQADSLRKNTFTKTGYHLIEGAEWNTEPDGSGISFSSGDTIYNLTDKNGAVINLYAQWEPNIYAISEDKDQGVGGTDVFYEKYDTGFYLEEVCVPGTEIDRIELPIKRGYDFLGYYSNMFGIGTPVIKPDSLITFPNNTYLRNTTLFAYYKAKQFNIAFDKQEGTGGTDSAVVTYDQLLPRADAPIKSGYSFKGYYTEPNGQGDMYYNEFMASDRVYQLENDITLYAYWVDETAPEVHVIASTESWTNRNIVVRAVGTDYGAGLSSLQLYMNDVLITDESNLNGVMYKDSEFINTTEGVIVFKAVATDTVGNTAEAYKTVKYDVTPPVASNVNVVIDGTTLNITLDVTDKNVQ